MPAAVSVDYYVRLKRGRAGGASESVLDGIARALQLDEAERAHLFLVYSAEPGTPSDDAIKLLATWAATIDQADQGPGRPG